MIDIVFPETSLCRFPEGCNRMSVSVCIVVVTLLFRKPVLSSIECVPKCGTCPRGRWASFTAAAAAPSRPCACVVYTRAVRYRVLNPFNTVTAPVREAMAVTALPQSVTHKIWERCAAAKSGMSLLRRTNRRRACSPARHCRRQTGPALWLAAARCRTVEG